jgi:hypothetical protein
MSIEMALELYINVSRTIIHKQAATSVQCRIRIGLGGVLDAKTSELSAFSGADEMVNKDQLARLAWFWGSVHRLVLDSLAATTRNRATVLLSILTGSTLWRMFELRGCTMELLVVDRLSKNSHPKEKLYYPEGDMAQALVPTEQFLFRFREVHVLLVDGIDIMSKVDRALGKTIVSVTGGGGKVVEWGNPGFNRTLGGIICSSHQCHGFSGDIESLRLVCLK